MFAFSMLPNKFPQASWLKTTQTRGLTVSVDGESGPV